jgi:hypothetical protein
VVKGKPTVAFEQGVQTIPRHRDVNVDGPMTRSRSVAVFLCCLSLTLLIGCESAASTANHPSGVPGQPSQTPTVSPIPPVGDPGPIKLHGRIAVSMDRAANVDIYVLDLPSRRLHRLTNSPAADLSPTWSPDGSRIAFRSDRDGNDEVYVMNADGTEDRNITRDPASDYSPAWSPDGASIAFASTRADPTGNDIWIMKPDGSEAESVNVV